MHQTPELSGERLLRDAGFEVLASRRLILEDTSLQLKDALAQWTPSLAHPVCWPLRQRSVEEQDALHAAYCTRLIATAQEESVRQLVQVNLRFGHQSATSPM